ncbi:serine/threonine-protein kinase mos-like isoform X1 [Tigriopus californicus]|uniref:serine/threonine-protein kinase mos-like isoform X1 n=1 Tax=Tigriopus californicus TaxID=6832 RepID=UPI0027DA21CA|nr:serine/threonine-protein kinase mos-like isoform X1 [Tigriopus californicus]
MTCTGRKKSRLSARTDPLNVPPRIQFTHPAPDDEDIDDEVFVQPSGPNKENLVPGFLSPSPRRKRLSCGVPSLSHSPSLNEILCLNSPGRWDLQRQSLDSRKDLHYIGRGSFGSVILGSWKGQKVAVKVISRDSPNKKISKKARSNSVESELNATDLCHPNVVKIHAMFDHKEAPNTIIIMEYVGKSSLQRIIDHNQALLTPGFVHKCFVGVASAMKYIHSMGILHLDIKANNVFVSSFGDIKLGDFGCSRMADSHHIKEGSPCKDTLVGTPGFQAPEFLRGARPTAKCDIYSYGVFLWQVINREIPFRSVHAHSIIFQVVSQDRRPCHHIQSNKRTPFQDLYEQCWQTDMKSRPEASQILLKLDKIKFADPLVARKKSSMRF